MARENDPSLEDLFAQVDDQTITMAICGAQDLEQRWIAVPPSGTLKLFWPLACDFFAVTTGSTATANDQSQHGTERPVRARPSGGASTPDYST